MNIVVTTEQRFFAHDGAIYVDGMSGYRFWHRYLQVFDAVYVMARITMDQPVPARAVRADGPGVYFVALPYYVGPLAAAMCLPQLLSTIWRNVPRTSAYSLRTPGVVATLLYIALRLRRLPYAVEVVGDPNESLSYRALHKWWSLVARWPLVAVTRHMVANATCSSYVTARTLQARYPNSCGGFTNYVSDVALPEYIVHLLEGAPAEELAVAPSHKLTGPLRLIFVGSLAQRYKGLHVLLEALAQCLAADCDMLLHVIGDGEYRAKYVEQSERLGLADRVVFLGSVTHEQVFEQLLAADLFVMPSLVEGLPRAMIEAMACALPVIGSDVGGIPELLSDEMMVPPGNVAALAAKLLLLARSPDLRAAVAARNRRVAADYHPLCLSARHRTFLQHVRLSSDHNATSGVPA